MPATAVFHTTVDLRLYTVEAMHAAVYRFADKGCCIDHVDWDKTTATVVFNQPPQEDEQASLLTQFKQELNDQTLRQRIRAETESIRNLILAHAFSDSALAEK